MRALPKLKSEEGMTLIEVIVAVAFVGISLAALITLGIMTARNADSARKRTQAVELSKEGIEAVRSIRDNISSFASGSAPYSVYDSANCTNYYPWTWVAENTCPWALDNFKLEKSGNSWFLQAVNNATPLDSAYQLSSPNGEFYRHVVVHDDVDGTTSKLVEVTVYWQVREQTFSVTQKTYLTNWR